MIIDEKKEKKKKENRAVIELETTRKNSLYI